MLGTAHPQVRFSRLVALASAAALLAATLVAGPLASPSRADATFPVVNEAEYRSALSDCEDLTEGEVCTIEFPALLQLSLTGGNPQYTGVADLHLLGTAGGSEVFPSVSGDLQFLSATTSAEVTIENLHISSFEWSTVGGAVDKINGDLTIIDSVFELNRANGGGAIHFADGVNLTIMNSEFTLNTVDSGFSGGAILINGGFAYIEGTLFDYNAVTGTGAGGAIVLSNDSTVMIANSTFEQNTSTQGGAIAANDFSDVIASNSTFYRNNGGNGGGAVWVDAGTVNLTHVTAYANVPGHVQVADVDGSLTSFATVFYDLTDVFPTCSIAGDAVSHGYNWAANTNCWDDGATGDIVTNADPMLGGLADNGGPTTTAKPGYASLLVDAIALGDCVEDLDQRGVVRPQGAGCDIGAVELVELEAPFLDVPISHPFVEEIAWLSGAGITGGFSDGTFRPTSSVTRQAMAAFLYRFSGSPEFSDPTVAAFTDVPTSHPFFTEVEWLADEGIGGGYDDGSFRPSASVSRQASAAFLYRLAGRPLIAAPDSATFTDVPMGHPFFFDIEWLAQVEVVGGYGDGSFRPTATVSRQAMAAFLYRFNQLELDA